MAKHGKALPGGVAVRLGFRVLTVVGIAAAGWLASTGAASAGAGGSIVDEEFDAIKDLGLPEPIYACDNGVAIGGVGVEVPVESDGCDKAAGTPGRR